MVVQLSENLYQGGVSRSGIASDFDDVIDEYGLDTLVSVTMTTTPKTTVHIPLTDDGQNEPEQVHQAIDETYARLRRGERVLVYCTMGTSRSIAVGAGVCALHTDTTVRDALIKIDAKRDSQPHPVLVEQTEVAVESLRDSRRDTPKEL